MNLSVSGDSYVSPAQYGLLAIKICKIQLNLLKYEVLSKL